MAVRLRANGEIVCAAMFPACSGDVYLDDAAHYRIAVELLAMEALPHGRWRFVAQGTRDLGETCDEHMTYECGRVATELTGAPKDDDRVAS